MNQIDYRTFFGNLSVAYVDPSADIDPQEGVPYLGYCKYTEQEMWLQFDEQVGWYRVVGG